MLIASIHDYPGRPGLFHRKVEALVRLPERQREREAGRRVGFWGQPDQKTMDIIHGAGFDFLDLDIDLGSPPAGLVPKAYCHIIQDIVNNALRFRDGLGLIVATSGPDKCDQGRDARDLLSRLGFAVLDASNLQGRPLRPALISTARGPLKERVVRIMELVYRPLTAAEEAWYRANQCEPSCNFHGVPPQDIKLLALFPEDTHIQGWTRLVEQGIPGRTDLEWQVDNDVPTVYFTQTFCNKELLARFLAERGNGLHVDGHGAVTGSVRAKLEAFLWMRAGRSRGVSG